MKDKEKEKLRLQKYQKTDKWKKYSSNFNKKHYQENKDNRLKNSKARYEAIKTLIKNHREEFDKLFKEFK